MKEIDFNTEYDKVLDIKPSYGYNRELGKVNKLSVGVEIEVAVNYVRASYSLIKKLLIKIKNIVGDNGYFVKDATVLGEYQFEIVLDPLTSYKIFDIYSKIKDVLEHSNGIIEISKEKNCGIHLNFNKNDVKNLTRTHPKLLFYLNDSLEYLNENVYKQYTFIYDYNDYLKYQMEISSKYVAVNYLKNKVIEIRNIDAEINPWNLKRIIDELLLILYDDVKIKKDHNAIIMNNIFKNIFQKGFSKLKDKKIIEEIKEDKIVIISLKTKKPKIISKKEYIDYLKEEEKI